MPKLKEKTVKDSVNDLYKLSLKVNEQNFEASCEKEKLADTLKSLVPILIKTKALVKVEFQGKVAEKMLLGALQCRKIRNIKTYADLFIRSLLVGL